MLSHLNHPNFHFAQTAEDLFALDHRPGDGFFEMYNGRSDVSNYGDQQHESTERIWNIVLAKRLGEFGRNSTGVTLESLEITDDHIELEIDATRGVDYKIEFVGTLQNADLTGRSFREPHEHEGSTEHLHQTIYRYSADIGKVLKTVNGPRARYDVQGDEIYVRARITSSRPHRNPFAEGDTEMAWTQPLVVMKNAAQR